VNDMLMFAKEGHLVMEGFSLQRLLEKVNDNMHDYSLNPELIFQLSNEVHVDHMLGNEDALLGTIMNLLNNALEAIEAKGLITLRVCQQDVSSIQLQIKDNGPRIDESVKLRLFEPFYSTKANGMGLGLAVVDSVVKAHSGSIQCISDKGRGTLFTLNLPCVNQYIAGFSDPGLQPMEHNKVEQQYEAL